MEINVQAVINKLSQRIAALEVDIAIKDTQLESYQAAAKSTEPAQEAGE